MAGFLYLHPDLAYSDCGHGHAHWSVEDHSYDQGDPALIRLQLKLIGPRKNRERDRRCADNSHLPLGEKLLAERLGNPREEITVASLFHRQGAQSCIGG